MYLFVQSTFRTISDIDIFTIIEVLPVIYHAVIVVSVSFVINLHRR